MSDPPSNATTVTREITAEELLASLDVRFAPKLKRFFRSRHLAEEPEDYVQETFTRVIVAARRGEPLRKLAGYVWCTAQQVALEGIRPLNKRRREEPLESCELPDQRLDPERDAFQHELVRAVAQALKKLAPQEQALIITLIANEEDRRKLCQQLNVSPQVLRSRLHRALQKLRREMTP